METEEKADKGDKTKSGCCGFDGRMLEMMRACCGDQGGASCCSTMMTTMTGAQGNQPCCSPAAQDTEPDRGKK